MGLWHPRHFHRCHLILIFLQVGDVIWGYDHPLIKLGNDVLPQEQKLPFNKFGFFVNVSSALLCGPHQHISETHDTQKNGSTTGLFEAMTGVGDLNNVGQVGGHMVPVRTSQHSTGNPQVVSFDGQTELQWWASEECNR